jgi:hypothetical protein
MKGATKSFEGSQFLKWTAVFKGLVCLRDNGTQSNNRTQPVSKDLNNDATDLSERSSRKPVIVQLTTSLSALRATFAAKKQKQQQQTTTNKQTNKQHTTSNESKKHTKSKQTRTSTGCAGNVANTQHTPRATTWHIQQQVRTVEL